MAAPEVRYVCLPSSIRRLECRLRKPQSAKLCPLVRWRARQSVPLVLSQSSRIRGGFLVTHCFLFGKAGTLIPANKEVRSIVASDGLHHDAPCFAVQHNSQGLLNGLSRRAINWRWIRVRARCRFGKEREPRLYALQEGGVTPSRRRL